MAKNPTAPDETVTIQSVRNKKRHISISWKQGEDTCSRDFHDAPLPGFYKALEALKPIACSLAEFPASDVKKTIVHGITLSERGDRTFATIVCGKQVRKKKRIVNFNTPTLPLEEDDENKALDHLDEDDARAVEKVIKETLKYLSGERAQGKIQFEEEKPEKKEDDDKTENLPLGEGEPPAS